MNRVITINLNGIAYQLEESGYEALREYLDNAARRLGNNPDKDEIIADIEQAIADKFRALLGAYKTVVITKEVIAVIAEMGPVEDASAGEQPSGAKGQAAGSQPGTAEAKAGGAEAAGDPKAARRLYRIYDGAMISGVCNGIAAYYNIDVTFVRIFFAILALTWGAGILMYLLLSFIVPVAETPAEKAAASGAAATAQEFIRRAKAGYYEGMKSWHDKAAHRAWKRKFKQEMRGWKHGFQQEMQENAHQWQQNWEQHWGRHPRPFGAVIAWPFLALCKLGLLLVMVFAVLSLIGYGSVFGIGLPSGVPLWVGVLFLVVLYHLLTWPIRVFRHSCCYRGGGWYGYRPPMAGLWDTFVWLGFCVGAIWLADHYSPQFHAWLADLPSAAHHFLDSARAWWNRG